jgi:hypothetical protein
MGTNKSYLFVLSLLIVLSGNIHAEAQTTGSTNSPQAATTTPTLAPMVGYCTTSVFPGNPGEYNVLWTVYANPAVNATYTWSGAASSTGNYSTVNARFNSSGRRTAAVRVQSGSQSMTLACGADFIIPNIATSSIGQYRPIGGKCQPYISGLNVSWSAYSTGARSTTTFSWVGDGFATTTQDASQLFEVPYTTEGVKSAQVQIQADGQTITLLCQAKVASTTGCFIATAAFGTEMESEVLTLRKFRDDKLLTNKIGKAFVTEYYKVSPPIADYIRNKPILKLAVRAALRPVIYAVNYKL